MFGKLNTLCHIECSEKGDEEISSFLENFGVSCTDELADVTAYGMDPRIVVMRFNSDINIQEPK